MCNTSDHSHVYAGLQASSAHWRPSISRGGSCRLFPPLAHRLLNTSSKLVLGFVRGAVRAYGAHVGAMVRVDHKRPCVCSLDEAHEDLQCVERMPVWFEATYTQSHRCVGRGANRLPPMQLAYITTGRDSETTQRPSALPLRSLSTHSLPRPDAPTMPRRAVGPVGANAGPLWLCSECRTVRTRGRAG